ncbi:ORF MSV155 putative RNA polymerase second largest subunit cowpox RPO132 homolog (vaccinia A24R), similar to SW:P17474 [Melanoplus sanguinipes entomopoxvirus]|uniref:DNA-directed RNA polymerase n=1 Tax=Melanoplus sanguinipes entomopoxvirus TaxID=83191 RepID=Q9YVT7_MSEPV|nr:ORF MSV155 putative RNA polymerase second largest subunit cowpox RPO132 homolog (vaccinia A24R), similar to SW:P17474 [Melanoplus sanguinipes entomopoxvirus]AAC97782.1 ORF MSV155 putative RNA polymerase second largest subunit cowpox RPO132 homolog (vaccinia A24R), similar to SW:P17474 [Melanoplus sanguinipes entomopoxvirus 'O']
MIPNNIEEYIAKLYLSSDNKLNIKSKSLINIEIPFRNFNHDLSAFFTREEVINVKSSKSSKEEIILKIEFSGKQENKKSYIYSSFDNKSFDLNIGICVSIFKKIINQDGESKLQLIYTYNCTPNEIRIPQYISYGGNTPMIDNSLTETNNPGGSFILSKGITKFVTCRIEQMYVYPKLKKMNKPFIFHCSFISKHPSFRMINEKIYPPQFLTIDIDYTPGKIKCVIDSKKAFIQIDLILLIHFYSEMSFEDIESIIKRGFNNSIVRKIQILIKNSQMILANNENNIHTYVSNVIKEAYINKFKNDKNITLQAYTNSLLSNFLPHITNGRINKGMYLISIFRQFIVGMFQPDIYPDKDNLATRRISTAADIFESIIKSSIDTLLYQIKEKSNEFKIESKINQNINNALSQIKLIPQITPAFNNFFNMQDTKNSDVVKISTKSNWQEPIIVSNAVMRGSSIELTKSLEARNLHESTIGVLDIYDTPDHGSNAGLIKRLTIGTIISHHTLKIRERIFNEVNEYILTYAKTNNIINKINGVIISIIEESSEFYVTSIDQSKVDQFVKDIKLAKISNIFCTNDIGIEVIPIHEMDKIKKINVPTNRYFQIRINVGNRRALQPMFIVENGILNLDKYKIDKNEIMSFSDIMLKYNDIIEFVDVGQALYSRICNSIKEFKQYSLEFRKTIQYVRLPNYIYFSQLVSCMHDVGKMAGVRGTFGAAQYKHIITGPQDNILNKFESCTYLSFPLQKSCVTNIPKDISGISKNGMGQHILVGFFSYNKNIEDGVIVNKRSVENGMLSVITLNAIVAEVSDIQINNNNPSPDNANNNYSKINVMGLPDVGTVMVKNDALYRCLKPKYKETDDNTRLFDKSEPYVSNYPAVVERTRKQGTDIIKVEILLSSYRRLAIGDKLAKSVQKVTVADILDESELPYTKDGLRPDLIFNSTSITSRKTFPMYFDAMLTNMFSLIPYDENNNTRYINYPTYTDMTSTDIIEYIRNKIKPLYPNISDEELNDIVYCRHVIYNPDTHKPMELVENGKKTKAFVAPILFSRLSQMSADKLSVRNRGRLDKYGQPPSGKKKGGGIKIGEMEVDVFLTYSVPSITLELLSDPSEKYLPAMACSNCGIFATYEDSLEIKRWKCLQCENIGLSPKIISFRLPYSTKMFLLNTNMRGITFKIREKQMPTYYLSISSTK